MTRLEIDAPAKINLYLNVLGRLDNGYHRLDSLVAFADVGDRLLFEPSAAFELRVQGPFAGEFNNDELGVGPESRNLAARAAWAMARAAGREPMVRITLTKNLPLASGIGGGSADAAAVMRGLMAWWGLDRRDLPWLDAVAAGLGADVPVCLASVPMRMRGIGERLDAAAAMPDLPVLLVNPGVACPTAQVFRAYAAVYSREASWPSVMDRDGVFGLLAANGNDLTSASVSIAPEIAFVLEDLQAQNGCRLARMAGSGATCFGLFGDRAQVAAAGESLAARHPGWWVRGGVLRGTDHPVAHGLEMP